MRFEKSDSDKYIEDVFVTESNERLQILKDLIENNKNGIQVSPSEGHLLKFFSKLINAKKIVEIGTLFGYSTSWFLESVFEDDLLDSSELKKVWSLEKDEFHFKMASKHLAEHIRLDRLEILLGEANENLKSISRYGPFDLIFIDANKSGYMDYFNWAEQNLRSGGLIIADNTFLLGLVFNDQEPSNHQKAWKIIREFNNTIASHPSFISTMIPTNEGLTIAFKK